ncbi:MAG: glycosyl hydrolase family 18 protein [Pseudomonadota bacterium]|nr:glycosyl hydrolase family 18 protein [Pseudomonadota bacterium]
MFLLLAPFAAAAPVPGPHAQQVAQYGALPMVLPGASPRMGTRPPGSPGPAVTVYGYHAYWSADPTALDFERLTHLALFNVDLNSDGSLGSTEHWTDIARAVVPVAHSYGVRVHLCVTAFDENAQTQVFASPTLRAIAIANMKALVDDYGADGVMIDIEAMDVSNRDGYSTFVEELSAAVDDVFLSTPAVNWSGAFDYGRLAAATEGLFIMAYNYHWSGGDPGPNDPLYGASPWDYHAIEWSVDDYVASGAPHNKLILGLPLYGWEWPTDGARVPGTATGTGHSVLMAEAVATAAAETARYDAPSRSPYLLRSDSQLWYADTNSVQERVAWAVGNRLQGVGFWALGYEGADPAFWDMVGVETAADHVPEPEDTGDTDDPEDTGDTDDTDVLPDTEDTDLPEDTDGADTARDTDPAVGGDGASGCGCAAGPPVSAAGVGLLALLGAALRVRRRPRAS